MDRQLKRGKRIYNRSFLIYSFFLLLLACAIVLMPFANTYLDTVPVLLYLAGAGFWIGLAGSIGTAVLIGISRKKSTKFAERYPDRRLPGLLLFFQNREAMVMDILMLVSFAAAVVTGIFTDFLYAVFCCMAVFAFSFGMHCMLNGLNYKYLKMDEQGGKEDEKDA